MIKKKVKKIPKYAGGGVTAQYLDQIAGKQTWQTGTLASPSQGVSNPIGVGREGKHNITGPSVASGGSGFGGWGGTIGAAATAGGKMLMDAFGVEDNSQLGTTLNTSMQGAEIGGAIVPGWGHLIGGVAGGLIGATKAGSVDENTGEITYGGIFGHSKDYLLRKSNMIKNSIQSKLNTQNIQADYYNDPNVVQNANVLAAEGAIIRKPVDALVSKGELIYDPETKQLHKVPGSKGKPNKKDDVAVKLYEGDVVVSNSPTMMMSNGKTPAQNLERMVTIDKKKGNKLSEGTTKAREAIIKKVVNWLEANKTKPQEYAMYSTGTGYVDGRPVVIREDGTIWYTDGKPGGDQYKGDPSRVTKHKDNTSFLSAPKQVREKTVESREDNVYTNPANDFAKLVAGIGSNIYDFFIRPHEGFGSLPAYFANTNLMSGDPMLSYYPLQKNNEIDSTTRAAETRLPLQVNKPVESIVTELPATTEQKKDSSVVSDKKTAVKQSAGKKATISASQEEKRTPEQIAESLRIADIGERHWLREPIEESKQSLTSLARITPEKLKGQKLVKPTSDNNDQRGSLFSTPNWLNTISDLAPLASALFGDYDYHTEQAYINPAKYIPTGVNIDPIRRAADESYALARYNQANISPNTGAGMAYGLQAASNRAKQLADAYQWQQEQQNKLIAQNVGIYNDWAAREAQARHIANTETRQNEAAADYMKRMAIKSGLDWYQGRRRDRQILPALKQYLSSGMYQSTLDNLNV